MAEITRKRTGQLLRKLFDILIAVPEGMAAREALEKLATSVTMTPYEQGTYASGDRRFEKIVRFATVDCVKAGWLTKHKGTWTVTDAGLQAFNAFPDPEGFYREACRLYAIWRAAKPGQTAEAEILVGVDDEDSAKGVSISFDQAEEQAWTEIEAFLASMPPFEFQALIGDLLRAMGYHVAWTSPPGKDGGVDIIAHTDPLGTSNPRIKVQVKRRADKIDVDGLKSFIAIVGNHDIGIFVAAGGFTRDAETFARSLETRRITLLDLEKVVDLWIKFYTSLEDSARRRFPLTPIYFLTPQD